MGRVALSLGVWSGVWVFWAFVSRNNQASPALLVIATTLLVGGCALAVHLNHGLWIPRLLRAGRPGRYALALGATLLGIAFVVAGSIHVAYDVLWGPDPLRFGWWANLGMDALFVSVHVLVAAGARALRAGWREKGRHGF